VISEKNLALANLKKSEELVEVSKTKIVALEAQLRSGKKDQKLDHNKVIQQAQLQVLIEFVKFVEDLRVLITGFHQDDANLRSVFENAVSRLKELKVFMLGDGLNVAGALRQANFGMVISENQNNFTPASDAILAASKLDKLAAYLSYAIISKRLVYLAYGFALIYNAIGLYFAVQGTLSPVVAAILMPTSSITVVVWGLSATTFFARIL
jgi:hypothetical protein